MRFELVFIAVLVPALLACSSSERRFPLRDPMWRDTDLASVRVRCHEEPTDEEPNHVSCAPRTTDATIYWDGADQMFFRPLSQAVGIARGGEAVNTNSLDEVPDSAWFTNRVGAHPVSLDELRLNACPQDKLLDPTSAPDGSWLIDQGKTTGSTPGFRMKVPGKGKYLVKVEAHGPERQAAATVIGEAVYWASGYNASCEQVLWVKPSIFKLKPGLTARRGNFGDLYAFNQKEVDDLFAHSTMQGGLLRITASSWIPGQVIGQFRYEGTRDDDPNDIVPHESRRELRGARVLASWIGHVDCREGNSLDAWVPDTKGGALDSSPGHVVHYQIGTSAAMGNVWDWDPISRRFNYAYILDWGDLASNFFTLGAAPHVYDHVQKAPGQEMFGYWNVADFDPDAWKNEYPNPAFDRMTERDAAWMARILARFTPAMVRTLAEMGKLSEPSTTDYLESVLEGRLEKILERYLTRLSPMAGVHVEGRERLCATDLADARTLRLPTAFHYTARWMDGRFLPLARDGSSVCVALPHVAPDGGPADDAAERYVRVRLEDGVARGPLLAYLYDLGPARGYRLVGLERPEE